MPLTGARRSAVARRGKGSSWPCTATEPLHPHQPWIQLANRNGLANTLPGTRHRDHNQRRFTQGDLCRERLNGNDPMPRCAATSTDWPERHAGAW